MCIVGWCGVGNGLVASTVEVCAPICQQLQLSDLKTTMTIDRYIHIDTYI